ncbi:MAG: TAT-variant-translocated molybdopterin oxidoreductase [Chthonomonas sp.]|nr:TAT-variant-translocated molybdopterin oxidoreductase [Chthonomonas sp.]
MADTKNQGFDIAAVREKLAKKSGPEYWRSFEEVAETPEFHAWVEDEFPNRSSLLDINRRDLIKFMGASMMLAGLAGCRSLVLPTEKVVPYVTKPEDIIPGRPLQFATVLGHNQSALGVLVTSYEGRPVKVEGNPNHPQSKGRSSSFAQAAILDMYDPDRAREVHKKNFPSTWDQLGRDADAAFTAAAKDGKAIVILTETIVSPTLKSQITRFQAKYPNAEVMQYDAVSPDNMLEGNRMALGQPALTVPSLDGAEVILAVDADLFGDMPDSVRLASEFAAGRGLENTNRLYAIESTPTLAGAMADHRRAAKPSLVEAYLEALHTAILGGSGSAPTGVDAAFVAKVAADLKGAGKAVVVAGFSVSAAGHAHVAHINDALSGVQYQAPLMPQPGSQLAGLRKLTQQAAKGEVGALVILGGDPVYNAPADLKFAEALSKIPFSVHQTEHYNDTSFLTTYQAPCSHVFEGWGDLRSLDGTVSVQQPLIAPLFNTKTASEMIASLAGRPRTSHELVKETYAPIAKTAAWDKALHDGVIANSGAPKTMAVTGQPGAAPKPANGLEIAFRPDPTLWDGRYANNGWMQELPKPLTTITWDNPALISPRMADQLGIKDGAHIKVVVGDKSVELPALICVGHADDCITLMIGSGRKEVGSVGHGAGVNVNPVRNSAGFWMANGAVELAGGRTDLALTQTHHSMQGRDIVRAFDVEDVRKGTMDIPEHHFDIHTNMYPDTKDEFPWDGAQWAMTIDLNLCTGCNACVTACQAENNIPVVGKLQVLKGREMHWIRIDRYYRVGAGNEAKDPNDQLDPKNHASDVFNGDEISTVMMPLACMHCEIAPCEPVCPVAATVHSHEGLNQMVYNRCVGTRYCSNNCPYKVRRFNFLNYTDNQGQFMDRTEVPYTWTVTSTEKPSGRAMLKLLNNPNVTVRGRGVMEKCTYCVQRINAARIDAKRDKRAIADGEIITACQGACPTNAIVFGNIADANSVVSKNRKNPRNYFLLEELNTRNRTTYLAKMRNPNPEMNNV